MAGKSTEYLDADDIYIGEAYEDDFRSNYPLRRFARIFAYVSAFLVSYVLAIVAVFYLATWIKG